MANIRERRNKDGKITSFSIRVHRGTDANGRQLKPYTTKFKPEPTWKEDTARKKAQEFATRFEKECKEGRHENDRMRFDAYCEYVLDLKVQRGKAKHSTISRYKELTERIYPIIGHIRVSDLRASHLNDLYTYLAQDGLNKKTGGKLAPKTIIEHHRLISTVLEQAFKEGIVLVNVAKQAEIPKAKKMGVNYYQPDALLDIMDAAKSEPIKWRVLILLLISSGARRGEILGLRWSGVNFDKSGVQLVDNVLYTPEMGIYIDTLKTEKAERFIVLPEDTMDELRAFKDYQKNECKQHEIPFDENGFVFCQVNGKPMHPDSVNVYLRRFAERHSLQHVNPHAFRHTMASLLYVGGADSVSISNRLGHAQVSTTTNIYAHIIEEADKKSADILAEMLKKKP